MFRPPHLSKKNAHSKLEVHLPRWHIRPTPVCRLSQVECNTVC